MTQTSPAPRSRSIRLLRVGLPAFVALALAACGTIPPEPPARVSASPTRSVAGPSTPRTTATGRGTASSPAATPARPSSAAPTKGGSTKGGSTKGAPAPAGPWVAHFRGQAISVPRGHGATVSFTFDDGPWPGSTTQVLALLKKNHVHATFCLIGNQAKAYPTLVRHEVAGGHELCDHSRDHDLTMNKKGARYVDAEVGVGLADIRRAAPKGTPVSLYRQPGGLWSPAVVRAMDKRGLDPLRWSSDPRDWSRPGSTVIVRRVVASLHPGVVILMHDGGGDRSQTVEALAWLLRAVVAAGWKPVLAPHVKLSAKAAARPQ